MKLIHSLSKMKIIASILLSLVSTQVLANIYMVKSEDIKNSAVKSAKIVYTGNVNQYQIFQLMSSLNEINVNYPSLKKIYLYINSNGGSMDSGYIAYEAIKSSPIPVTTVNISMVASSATMFYCAGKERLAMNDTLFLLHPSSYTINSNTEFKPDTIARLKDVNDKYNNMFDRIYKTCTSFTDDERKKILHSESTSALIDERQAKDKKLVTGTADGFINSDVSYYITEGSYN